MSRPNFDEAMKHLTRVVWSEGMHLGPQHFQAQSRYFEDSLHFATTSLWFAPYGLIGWALDGEALRNGLLSIVHARGVFPDGLPFNMPESDVLPPPRNIVAAISPVRDSVTVMLGIPRRIIDGMNVAESEAAANSARYSSEVRSLHDENTGRDEKPIKLARKNIRLLLDDEVSDDIVPLVIARVKRDGAGHLMFDPDFVPSCLDIGGSERLMNMVRRLIDILEEKSATLALPHGAGVRGFSQQELAKFWLLHSVNSCLPQLRHLYLAKRGHPEELYLVLAGLAGALCTFGLESDPRKVPLYTHDNLTDCFAALDQHIRTHLETIIPTNAVSIPLKPVEDYMYAGNVGDQNWLSRSRWIFGIEASVGEADLISKTPQLVKICSQAFVSRLVQKALPGLTLTHLPLPPPAVSPRIEMQYFAVSKAGPCWDHITATRQVGIYVPGELTAPRIELFVILES
jgi:type VI secretion system protein ImpJ